MRALPLSLSRLACISALLAGCASAAGPVSEVGEAIQKSIKEVQATVGDLFKEDPNKQAAKSSRASAAKDGESWSFGSLFSGSDDQKSGASKSRQSSTGKQQAGESSFFGGLFGNDAAAGLSASAGSAMALDPNYKFRPKSRNGSAPFDISRAEVQQMLIRSDPKVCSATQDASLTEMIGTYGKVIAALGSHLAKARLAGDGEMRRQLGIAKPYLKELAHNTTWLPVQAERLIGDRLYAYNGLNTYQPKRTSKKLLDETIRPMFKALKALAEDELGSPIEFDLRVIRDAEHKAPSVIPGGIVLIPSGMLNQIARMKEPTRVIAFMLAHEFSHAMRRHNTKMVQISLVDAMTTLSIFKKNAKETSSAMGGATRLDQLFSLSENSVKDMVSTTCRARDWRSNMEQSQEYEADVCGSLLLKLLGASSGQVYSPVEGYRDYMTAGFATSKKPVSDGACTVHPGHPNPPDRLKNLKAYAVSLKK